MKKFTNKQDPIGSDNTLGNHNSCAKCGACTAVCPVYQVTGQESLTARGRLHLLGKSSNNIPTKRAISIFSKCLLCNACKRVCPRGIDFGALLIEHRQRHPEIADQSNLAGSLIKKCLPNQSVMRGIGRILRISDSLLNRLPVDSGLRLKLGLSFSEGLNSTMNGPGSTNSPSNDSGETTLFTGCYAKYLDQSITRSAIDLTSTNKSDQQAILTDQNCCGLAFYSSGNLDEAKRLAKRNIEVFEQSHSPIAVLCGSCFKHLDRYPTLLVNDGNWHARALAFAGRLQELSVYLRNNQGRLQKRDGENKLGNMRAVYHDPCHLRHQSGFTESPRELLNKLPWLELVEMPNPPRCCGFGGLFNLAHPDISRTIAGKLIGAFMTAKPDLVITSCSGCLIQIGKNLANFDKRIRVLHLAQVLRGKYNL